MMENDPKYLSIVELFKKNSNEKFYNSLDRNLDLNFHTSDFLFAEFKHKFLESNHQNDFDADIEKAKSDCQKESDDILEMQNLTAYSSELVNKNLEMTQSHNFMATDQINHQIKIVDDRNLQSAIEACEKIFHSSIESMLSHIEIGCRSIENSVLKLRNKLRSKREETRVKLNPTQLLEKSLEDNYLVLRRHYSNMLSKAFARSDADIEMWINFENDRFRVLMEKLNKIRLSYLSTATVSKAREGTDRELEILKSKRSLQRLAAFAENINSKGKSSVEAEEGPAPTFKPPPFVSFSPAKINIMRAQSAVESRIEKVCQLQLGQVEKRGRDRLHYLSKSRNIRLQALGWRQATASREEEVHLRGLRELDQILGGLAGRAQERVLWISEMELQMRLRLQVLKYMKSTKKGGVEKNHRGRAGEVGERVSEREGGGGGVEAKQDISQQQESFRKSFRLGSRVVDIASLVELGSDETASLLWTLLFGPDIPLP